jgi:hypothetical protein
MPCWKPTRPRTRPAPLTPRRFDPAVLAQIRNHYLGALAKGRTDNQHQHTTLATQAHRLIRRFTRYEDMILRFATDLTVPFTNYVEVPVMPMPA